jgi:tetratricopeptide (TPR) repeat protein
MRKTSVQTDRDLSGITIPRTDLSLPGVAAFLRDIFPGWQKKITGEFTQSGNKLALQLRLNGRKIFGDVALSADPEAADKLIGSGMAGGGAFEVVQAVEPFIAAAFLQATGNRVAANQVLDDIISHLSPGDPNVIWAYNLKGNNYIDQQKPDAAIAAYQKAIELDPKWAPAHYNLGLIYYDQHKLDAAIAAYQKAIELDPKWAPPHYNLGLIYRDQHKLDEACKMFINGGKLAPEDPDYPTRVREVDQMMNGDGHCTPL